MSKKDLGTEADSLNNGETKADSVQPLRGAIPKIIQDPIRKRAYYRALKRGAGWALFKQSMDNIMKWINEDMYRSVFESNKLLSLSESLQEPYEVKIAYGSSLPEDKK